MNNAALIFACMIGGLMATKNKRALLSPEIEYLSCRCWPFILHFMHPRLWSKMWEGRHER